MQSDSETETDSSEDEFFTLAYDPYVRTELLPQIEVSNDFATASMAYYALPPEVNAYVPAGRSAFTRILTVALDRLGSTLGRRYRQRPWPSILTQVYNEDELRGLTVRVAIEQFMKLMQDYVGWHPEGVTLIVNTFCFPLLKERLHGIFEAADNQYGLRYAEKCFSMDANDILRLDFEDATEPVLQQVLLFYRKTFEAGDLIYLGQFLNEDQEGVEDVTDVLQLILNINNRGLNRGIHFTVNFSLKPADQPRSLANLCTLKLADFFVTKWSQSGVDQEHFITKQSLGLGEPLVKKIVEVYHHMLHFVLDNVDFKRTGSVLNPNAPVPEPDAPENEPDAPVPEPDAPVPEPDAPMPEPDAPVPEPDAPVLEPDKTDSVPDSTRCEPNETASEPDSSHCEPSGTFLEFDETDSEPHAKIARL